MQSIQVDRFSKKPRFRGAFYLTQSKRLRSEFQSAIAVFVLDAVRKTDLVQKVQERLRRQFFDVCHLLHIPFTCRDQHGGSDRRNAGGVGNALRTDFFVSVLVVGHIVDEDFAFLAVLDTLDDIADTGLADVIGRERGRIGQHGLDHLERHDFQTFRRLDRLFGQEAKVLQHGEDVDVVIAEAHPEAHIGTVHVLGKRMHLVMAGHISLLLADDGQIEFLANFEHLVRLPLAILPGINDAREFAEIDFRIEVGGEPAAVAAGVDIDDIDRRDLVEILILGKARIGVDHARVETDAENGGNALFLAFLRALPLVVSVPRRRLADLGRILVDRRIHIGNPRVHAGTKNGHVDKSRTDIDDDFHAGFLDQGFCRLDIHRVKRMGLKLHFRLEALLFAYGLDNLAALFQGP
ncbi:Hypothetical protein AT6N2_L0473 [Agrobacterium tumefaciens]|nr:Hypothetical protein AT6N2_L0473 [Agrobacterium tumefaciens]